MTLMFHTGASLANPDGLLEGDGDTARSAKFTDADDLAAKRHDLKALVRAWIDQRDG